MFTFLLITVTKVKIFAKREGTNSDDSDAASETRWQVENHGSPVFSHTRTRARLGSGVRQDPAHHVFR